MVTAALSPFSKKNVPIMPPIRIANPALVEDCFFLVSVLSGNMVKVLSFCPEIFCLLNEAKCHRMSEASVLEPIKLHTPSYWYIYAFVKEEEAEEYSYWMNTYVHTQTVWKARYSYTCGL